ncbi:Acetophenone carboxylase delta subunit [Methylobacterium crusticola]|uniref:Acetophenone carboxylase delta subunit n=1 Tax=Methylobacterium crusticola TaxID=1697972 RepID=A0ABQ4R8U7_9HYPH|nr:hydantoinase B/oxoprolinase family protein [Methylobacterium crusticola]GJD53320.1 Acetophenone carboxylase delta subunit [Methylobacterium crusticola]
MNAAIDPITRSVIQHRLGAIAVEMGESMLRTSYSQILNSSRDFSVAICDVQARLVAQADHIPVHVGALPWAVRAVEARFAEVAPGDVVLLNDPDHGGSHLPDLTVFVPVFGGGTRRFWTVVRAHQSDIGGSTHGAYNPRATEIWQEGLRIPPLKLYEAGRLRDDLLDMLALNTRNGRDFRGDLAATVGAAHLGERRMRALFGEFGGPVVAEAVEEIFAAAEQQTRAIVSTWADGVFRGEAVLDDDGHGREDIRIVATVTKRGSDVEVDLSASDPQTTSFVNSSHANMQAAVVMAFAYLIDPDIPKNAGALRPLTVVARPGTIVWAESGRPVTLCTSHPSNEIVEAVVKALAQSCPDRAMAGWGRRFRISLQGEDPRNGRRFIWHLFHARPGGGASPGGDGWSSIGEWHSVGGLKFGSVEVAEVRFPLHFRTHEFLPGTGGDGRHRGGVGVALDLVVETDGPALANTAGDGARHGACGLLGGKDGAPHDYRLVPAGRPERTLRTKEAGIEVGPGDLFRIRSGGGGGWGPPEERAPEARARDRLEGLVADDAPAADGAR